MTVCIRASVTLQGFLVVTCPGRGVRPHLQHPAVPPGLGRSRHTPDRLGSHREGRGSPLPSVSRFPAPASSTLAPTGRGPHHYQPICHPTPSSETVQRRRVLPEQCPIPGRRPVRLPADPRHHQRQQDRRHDHPSRTSKGEILVEHTRLAPGIASSATPNHPDQAPTSRECYRCPETSTVTDVLMHNCHRCPETGLLPE